MGKKDNASLAGSRAQRPPTPTHPPYIEMVQKALMEHGGEEGLTAEEINEYLIAANHDLSPNHGRLFPYYLSLLSQNNAIIQDPSSGRYTIPGREEVQRLRSQAAEVLCKLEKAEDRYMKNLAGPFVKEFHLSRIKKVKVQLAEAGTSSGRHEFKKPSLTHGSRPNIARSLLATAGEMSLDPGHRGPGPTAEQSGDEGPDPISNPAGNVSVRDPGLHLRQRSPGYLIGPLGNEPDEGAGSKAPGSASGPFKAPKNVRSQQGRGGADNPVGIGGPAVSPSGAVEPSQAAPERPANKPGEWIERKSKCGNVKIRIKHPASRSIPSDKPNDGK